MTALQPGVYRHYKGGLYRLHAVARHSETLEEMAVYQALYGARAWWVRPAAMWEETVQGPSGPQPRFAYLAPDEAAARRLLGPEASL